MYMNMENNHVHLNSDSDEASPHDMSGQQLAYPIHIKISLQTMNKHLLVDCHRHIKLMKSNVPIRLIWN